MKNLRFLLFFCIISQHCILSAVSSDQSTHVERGIITHTTETKNTIEFFFLKPRGEGPFPVLFLLHGYQPQEKNIGGKQFVENGYVNRFIKKGVAVVSVSVPGYGDSTGERDFGGPDSQEAIMAVISHCKQFPFIDSSKIGIYGISRGAQLAGMVSSRCPDVSIQILESGFYDLVSFCSDTPAYLQGIRNSIIEEGGSSRDALIARSPVYHTDSMIAATLLLQGEFDDRRQIPALQLLHQRLIEKGCESQLKIYLGKLHVLPNEKWETIFVFLRQHFFHQYGIGINASIAIPAIQVEKIYPDSPASRSGKLRVGDAILRISPNNDDTEIDTLRMPLDQFTSLALGEKGSFLRLHVQHFDLSFEDIIIERDSLQAL